MPFENVLDLDHLIYHFLVLLSVFENEELTKGLGMLNVLKHLVSSYLENFVIQFSEKHNQTTINRDVSRKQAIHLGHTVVF